MNSKLPFELIKSFDGITWIPTIKGGLSYDLLADPNCLMGDRDKKLVHFKVFNGDQSGHYVAATSLCTFEDDYQKHKSRKCSINCPSHPDRHKDHKDCENKSYCTYSKKYNHTFRFIFIGTNSKSLYPQQIKETYPAGSGKVLIGKLYIIPQLGKNTDEYISSILKDLTDISKLVDDITPKMVTPFAEFDSKLQDSTRNFLKQWEKLVADIKKAEAKSNTSRFPRPIAKFDLLLKLNGILLIKDSTDKKNARYFVGSGYEQEEAIKNIPMHRIFKTVASYVKFLFHKNYNHHDKNDSYTPVSNLRLVHSLSDMKLIAMHQMKALLSPVIQLRRDLYKNCYCNPVGIMGYARTYLECVRHQDWIDDIEYRTQKELLRNLKEDVESGYEHTRNSILDFLTVQNNPLAVVAVILTFVLAAKELIVLFDNQANGFGILSRRFSTPQEYGLILALSAIFGITLIGITTLFMRKSYFKAKKPRRNIFYSLTAGREIIYSGQVETELPSAYRLWLSAVSVRTSFNVYLKKYSKLILFIVLGIAVLSLLIGLFRLL